MKAINFHDKDDVRFMHTILNHYQQGYLVEEDANGYISSENESVIICQWNPILAPEEIVTKEFFLFCKPENTHETFEKMQLMIHKQHIDIVSLSTNDENYDFFLSQGYKVLRRWRPELPVTRFTKTINKEKLRTALSRYSKK